LSALPKTDKRWYLLGTSLENNGTQNFQPFHRTRDTPLTEPDMRTVPARRSSTSPAPVRATTLTILVGASAWLTSCQTRDFNTDSLVANKKKAPPAAPAAPAFPSCQDGGTEFQKIPQLKDMPINNYCSTVDAVFAKMEENRKRFWRASVLESKYGITDGALYDYFDNEGEKVAFDALERCLKNNSSTATGGLPLSHLSHHYYCTLPGYMPDADVNAVAVAGKKFGSAFKTGVKQSPLGKDPTTDKARLDDEEYRDWRQAMVNDPKARMWLHSGIRACFTYSLRGQLLQLDSRLLDDNAPRTQFIKRGPLSAIDPTTQKPFEASGHAGFFCLNDGRAANPAELPLVAKDAKGKPYAPLDYGDKAAYLKGKVTDAPRPFEWLFANQGDLFKFALLQHPPTPYIQAKLNEFYGISNPAALTGGDCGTSKDKAECERVKAECAEKRPTRRPEIEAQDGIHCRPDGAFTLAAETQDDDVN
jgi:hypothetical protein